MIIHIGDKVDCHEWFARWGYHAFSVKITEAKKLLVLNSSRYQSVERELSLKAELFEPFGYVSYIHEKNQDYGVIAFKCIEGVHKGNFLYKTCNFKVALEKNLIEIDLKYRRNKNIKKLLDI